MEPGPRFHFWIRRSKGDGAVYSIRFEVEDGRGLLRVARPGVLVDPPAREHGVEEKLTSAQVRASRFLHVWQNGRKRQGYVLSRLGDDVLSSFPPDSWEPLRVVSDSGYFWLMPAPPSEMGARLIEVVDGQESVDSLSMDPILGFAAPRVPTSPASASPLDAPDIAPLAEPPVVEEIEASAATIVDSPREVTEEVEAGPPRIDLGADLALFGRSTNLVRHLRREKLRDKQRISELTQEVDKLRAALEEATRRETELRTRVARYQRRLKARESAIPK